MYKYLKENVNYFMVRVIWSIVAGTLTPPVTTYKSMIILDCLFLLQI